MSEESPKLKFNPKIAVVGAGQIGGTIALLAGLQRLSNNIVLLDVVDGIPQGKSLDLSHAAGVLGLDCTLTGTNDLTEASRGLSDADVVIITAGVPRKPGMSRNDLLSVNAKIIEGLGVAMRKTCKDAFIVCITNPLDIMVNLFQHISGHNPKKLVGMAGVLDSARFRAHLAAALNVSVNDVRTMVLGGHGDLMVPLKRYTSVAGIPLQTIIDMKWISEAEVDKIVERTRKSGGEVVELLKQGSAFYAPACSALEMVEAYLRDEKKILCCSTGVKGMYGFPQGGFLGVPVVIGKDGIEKVLELPLSDTEKEQFGKSLESVHEQFNELCELGFFKS